MYGSDKFAEKAEKSRYLMNGLGDRKGLTLSPFGSAAKARSRLRCLVKAIRNGSRTPKDSRWRRLAGEYADDVFNASSLHGMRHFVAANRHYSETMFWTGTVVLACFFFLQLAANILNRYMTSPTVISIDREFTQWNLTFPAATICFKEINEDALEEIVEEFNVTDKDTLRTFLTQVAKFSIDSVNDEDIEDHPAVHPDRFLEIIDRLAVPFTAEIITSIPADISVTKIIGEMGMCYSLNSRIAVYNSPKYWLENRWDHVERSVADIHLQDGEQFIKAVELASDYEVYLHSPEEVAVLLYRSYGSSISTANKIYLRMLSMLSTPAVRSLTPTQRRCRYVDERVLSRSPVYSYNMCIMECRVRKIQELCGCIPHFYRRLGNEKVCPASDLKCVFTYRSVLLETSRNDLCNCLPMCEEDIFTVYEVYNTDTEGWSEIKFGIKDFPKYRLKREVLFGMTEVLVNCGGAAGLLLGSSVLSIMEIFYFAFLRLFWFYRRNH